MSDKGGVALMNFIMNFTVKNLRLMNIAVKNLKLMNFLLIINLKLMNLTEKF